jgi:hypothetical protein
VVQRRGVRGYVCVKARPLSNSEAVDVKAMSSLAALGYSNRLAGCPEVEEQWTCGRGEVWRREGQVVTLLSDRSAEADEGSARAQPRLERFVGWWADYNYRL